MTSNKETLKIAFVSANNPENKRILSGSLYFMNKSLQDQFCNIHYIEPFNLLLKKLLQGFDFITKVLFNKSYNSYPSIILSKLYARTLKQKLNEENFDLIFAPFASVEIAFLKTEIPILYVADTTFTLINNYYEGYARLLSPLKREGNLIEESTIKKSDIIVYSSEWAAGSAVSDYGADESKVHVVPFGANIEDVPTREEVFKKQKSNRCRLLFLGVDWERKGGSIAFETLLELEKLGVESELIVCGCVPPEKFKHESMTVIPFLDKNDKKQRKELNQLLLDSDFLILPTIADCTPVVFCEANAFGLPVLTTYTGGIPSVIQNGKNGYMLPLETKGKDYSKLIQKIYTNDANYHELIKNSRKTFEQTLNWDIWGISINKIIKEYLDLKSQE